MPTTAANATPTPISVVLAVIQRANHVLVAWRDQSLPHGGCWEFPGGKVKAGENPVKALARELLEELGIGIDVMHPTPLIRFSWLYQTAAYIFKVYTVTKFEGNLQTKFYPKLKWQAVAELGACRFPPANHAIVNAVRLPDRYLFTPESELSELIDGLRIAATKGVRLATFRAPSLSVQHYLESARRLSAEAASFDIQLLLHNHPQLSEEIETAGVHLSAAVARTYRSRPISKQLLLAVSCHNAAELEHAHQLDADFVVLGPIQTTASHPNAPVLGWEMFESLIQDLALPVYAIGGLGLDDLVVCRARGGQGIAAIRSLWWQHHAQKTPKAR